jgi:hypothetical protein
MQAGLYKAYLFSQVINLSFAINQNSLFLLLLIDLIPFMLLLLLIRLQLTLQVCNLLLNLSHGAHQALLLENLQCCLEL